MNCAPLIVIVGPTASGKSALAMRVAKDCGGEIICADSRTVYKDMDIGTAKPTKTDQRQVRHHLLDVVQPGQQFSAAQFKRLAEAAVVDISSRGKVPIMVGGTGLYVDSVLFDYKFGPPADELERKRLMNTNTERLRAICRQKNIKIPTNSSNRRHLIRAIELGGLISNEKRLRKDTLIVGIYTTKEERHLRITQRAEDMFKNGIVVETAYLVATYGKYNEALTGNAYRILENVRANKLTLVDAKNAIIRSDMYLAKRQMTWFKRNPHVLWSREPQELYKRIVDYLASLNK